MKEDNIVYCSRCGAEMKENSRYCMKCGNLNYEHESNEGMRPFLKNQSTETYQVGSGKFAVSDSNKTNVYTSIGNNTGSRRLSFFLTFSAYILCIICCFFLNHRIMGLPSSLLVMIISCLYAYIYAIELVFVKCNRPWWSSLIPIYNGMVLSDILFNKYWIGLLLLVPGIGIIVFLILLYHLGKKFNYNGILVVLFWPIYILLIGYGNHFFEGHIFVGLENDAQLLEKEYKYKKMFLFFVFICLLFSMIIMVWFHSSQVKEKINSFFSEYYVLASKKIVSKTEQAILDGKFKCKKESVTSPKVYYFYYHDLGDYINLPFYFLKETISGYVRVEVIDGKYTYFVSVGDTKKKIPEMEYHSVMANSVVDMKFEPIDEDYINYCEIN